MFVMNTVDWQGRNSVKREEETRKKIGCVLTNQLSQKYQKERSNEQQYQGINVEAEGQNINKVFEIKRMIFHTIPVKSQTSSLSKRKYFSRTPDYKMKYSQASTKYENPPSSLQFKQSKNKNKTGALQNYLKSCQQNNKTLFHSFKDTDKSIRHYFKKSSKSKSHFKESTITGSLSFRQKPKINRQRTNTGQNIIKECQNKPITKSMTSAKQISISIDDSETRPRKLSDASDMLHMRMIKESIIKEKGALSYDTSLISKLRNPLFNRIDDLKHSEIMLQNDDLNQTRDINYQPKTLLDLHSKQMTQSIHNQQITKTFSTTALDQFAKFRTQSWLYQPSKHIKTEPVIPINQNPEQ